jgi:hypothetical protein
MNCDEAQERIGAWIDRQLDTDEVVSLEGHLSICDECRSASESLRAQDADLLRAFGPHREAALGVADRVIDTWKVPLAPPARGNVLRWGTPVLAAAAGFLLAVLIFQPWTAHAPIVRNPIDPPDDRLPVEPAQPLEPTLASLVVATGNVEVREQGADAWQSYTDSSDFSCAFGDVVKTGPDVRCELLTSDGCVIRLNADTEIRLTSASAIEVQRGEVWCSAPENVSLKVSAPEASGTALPPVQQSLWSAQCPSNARMMTAVARDGGVQVTAASGEIELQTQTGHDRLRRGETATFVAGRIVKGRHPVDPLIASTWMHPLLIRKGHADKELAGRVDKLLAQLGRSKLTVLYEQEIRSLGEYAVLPLLRYVQSPISRNEQPRRQTAMRILSDIAPDWAAADLVELLSDQEADTRYFAARALHRLTGLDQGRPATRWREDLKTCRPTIERWQQWWFKNRGKHPPPMDADSAEQAPGWAATTA